MSAWPGIVGARREASALYVWVAIKSWLMTPAASARALWAIGRRGVSALAPAARLATTEVAVVLVLAGVFAVAMRFVVTRQRAGFDLGHYMGFFPYAYRPHIVVSALFAVGWALGVVPGDTLMFSAATRLAPWALAYQGIAWAAVAVSLGGLVPAVLAAPAAPVPAARGADRPSHGHPHHLALAIVLALSGAAVGVGVAKTPERYRPVGPGDRVSVIPLRALDASVAPSTLRFPQPAPVVLDFWATWCPPCIAALPGWQELADESATLGATLISMNTEPDARRDVMNFLAEKKYSFPVHVDDGELGDLLQIETLPTVVVLDRQGGISAYFVGLTSAGTLRDAIAEAAAIRP